MKNLLFSLPYGIGFRNVVCCGIVDACLSGGGNATVLLPELSARDRERLDGQLPQGVSVRNLMPVRHSASFTVLKLLKQHLYAQRTKSASFTVKRDRRRQQRPLIHAGASLLEKMSEMCCSEEWVDDRISRARQPFEAYYEEILREQKIDVVVLAKPGYQPEDLALIRAARANGRRTIAIDTTWDNIVSKRPTYLAPEGLSAWSQQMKDEAVRFYRFDPDRVFVTGGAAFDVFFQRERLEDRASFLRSLQLDPHRNLIVYALNNPLFNPQNGLFVEFLLDAVANGSIEGTPNVVVRTHPWDRNPGHERLVGKYPFAHLERPFGPADVSSVYECVPTRDEVLHYGALVTHADVLVNIGSTTSLDAIAADTPVVNIAFDIETTEPALSAERFYDYSHYKPIVESRAVTVARSAEEFFAAVNAYVRDQSLDREYRTTARRRFLTYDDGNSARRVADVILSLA